MSVKQQRKNLLVKLMKRKGDGVKKLRGLLDWAAFVLLTLPLSDSDFEAFNAGQTQVDLTPTKRAHLCKEL